MPIFGWHADAHPIDCNCPECELMVHNIQCDKRGILTPASEVYLCPNCGGLEICNSCIRKGCQVCGRPACPHCVNWGHCEQCGRHLESIWRNGWYEGPGCPEHATVRKN